MQKSHKQGPRLSVFLRHTIDVSSNLFAIPIIHSREEFVKMEFFTIFKVKIRKIRRK